MSTNSTGDHWITRSLDRKLRSKYRREKNRARIPWYLIVHGRTDPRRKKWYISETGVVSARLHRRFLAWDGKLKNPWPASNHAIHSTNRLSVLSSYLTDKRRKEEKKRREQRFCEASSPFSRNKLNFARVQENEKKWKKGCGERVLEWNRVTIYFYLGRSTGRYCFFTRCRRSRVSLRAFQVQERNQRERERKTDPPRDRKEN